VNGEAPHPLAVHHLASCVVTAANLLGSPKWAITDLSITLRLAMDPRVDAWHVAIGRATFSGPNLLEALRALLVVVNRYPQTVD
jgi:hypothetical protein